MDQHRFLRSDTFIDVPFYGSSKGPCALFDWWRDQSWGCRCIIYDPLLHPHQGLLCLGTNLVRNLSLPRMYPTAYLSLTYQGVLRPRQKDVDQQHDLAVFCLSPFLRVDPFINSPRGISPCQRYAQKVNSSRHLAFLLWSWEPSISLHQGRRCRHLHVLFA